MNSEPDIPASWENLGTTLAGRKPLVIYVLGPVDAGKSTLCRFLAGRYSGPVAYLDADTGQSTVGPPATAGLATCTGKPARVRETFLRFVGATSPQGHQLQHLVATARLLSLARELGAGPVLVDSPGFTEGPVAEEFQVRMIDLLEPDLVVAIHDGHELDGILANFRPRSGMAITSIAPSPHALRRSRVWRAHYRQERFRAYFSGHRAAEIPLEGTGFHGKIPGSFRDADWHDLLVALCDPDMLVVSLAIVEELDLAGGVLKVHCPHPDLSRVASVQVGSVRLEPGVDFDPW